MNTSSTLPAGWISRYAPDHGRLFYIYQPTGQTQWVHPLGHVADAEDHHRVLQVQQLSYIPPPPAYISIAPPAAPASAPQVITTTTRTHQPPAIGTAGGVVAGAAVGVVAGVLLSEGARRSRFDGGYGVNDVAIMETYDSHCHDTIVISNSSYNCNDVTITSIDSADVAIIDSNGCDRTEVTYISDY
ncbi:hypothetical protein BGZ75_000588, partial [Mortierella antarctica]